MAARNDVDTDSDPRSIIATRVFDAPRDLVFAVWTDPKHLAQWWGPHGFTTTTHSFDMRSGGVWRFVMHGPDGRDFQNRITYEEVVRPERIVYRHGGGEDVEPVQFKTTVTFEELEQRRRQDPHHHADGFPVGRRTRSRDQGIWRRPGSRADARTAQRIRRGSRTQSSLHAANAV